MSIPHEQTVSHDPQATYTFAAETASVGKSPSSDTTIEFTPTASAVDPPPGFVFEAVLGKGGMGIVYRARQVRLNRLVAVKMVLTANPSAVIRFLAEAEAVAMVKHPNVVEVYQFGEHLGRPFLVLEYCDGGDLTTKTKGGRTPPREAAELMAAIADGVNASHSNGIVHRDLKPQNVLLANGNPKVSDFGLAKMGAGADLTATEAIMGTPAYMSPEQAGGKTKFVGPESDVWSLGVMLYQLLAGKRPFPGPSNTDYFAQILNYRFESLRVLCPDIPRDLELIARKCLRHDPRERYANAGELAADLRRWQAGKSISARPIGRLEAVWKWARRNPAVAGSLAAAMLAMVAGTAISLWQASEAAVKAEELANALGEKTIAEAGLRAETEKLSAQLRESNRRLDLNRLREAQDAWEKSAVHLACEKLSEIAPENRCVAWGLLNHRFRGSDLTLRGHTEIVTGVAFSPDGRRIASGSEDHTARVWDAVTGQTVFELKGHTQSVKGVAFSPDGRRIATASSDGTARVWDAVTGQCVLELKGHQHEVLSVCFSPDGRRTLTAAGDGVARIWDAIDGRLLIEPDKEADMTKYVVFSPDGQRIATASSDGVARVKDAATGRTVLELKGHAFTVNSLAFSPDGRRIATGSEDTTARVWDATTGETLFELKDHKNEVTSVAFSPDGRRIVTASWDTTARVWDATTGQAVTELKGHTSKVTSAAFSPDGRRIVTGSEDTTVRVWDATTGQFVTELKGHSSRVNSTPFSPDGKWIVTGGGNQGVPGEAWVWAAATGRRVLELKGHRNEVMEAAFSPDGRRIATGSLDATARVWDAASGQAVSELKGHTQGVSGVAFSPDGKRIVTGSADSTARVWDTATGKAVIELKGHTQGVSAVIFSPDGKWIVTGSADSTARVWNAVTGQAVMELKGHTEGVCGVALSPDGKRIVTASSDNTARVWDAATGQAVAELKGHTQQLSSVGFSPDGNRIVTGSLDFTVRIWDAVTGQSLLELKGHSNGVLAVSISPDGMRLVTGSWDSTARVWETNFDPIPKSDAKIPPLDEVETARRRWIARPQPDRHADLAKQYRDDPFAHAVQRSLEQRSRGQLAVEALDIDAAQVHFLKALLLQPKPHQFREIVPPPRIVK